MIDKNTVEKAAHACEAQRIEDTGTDSDLGYNRAVCDCAAAVRALATTASTSAPTPSAKQEPSDLPAILFDGYAVYTEVKRRAKCSSRTSAENVSDTLDAVVSLIRRDSAPSASASPAAPEMPARPVPTHRCKVCGALWKLWANGEGHPSVKASWSLVSPTCGQCCDNVAMGDQIEPYSVERHRAAQEATLAKGIENMRRNMHDSGMDLGPVAAPVAGSQQVPEVTAAMVAAGEAVAAIHKEADADLGVQAWLSNYEEVFLAMLSAAPAVPVPVEQPKSDVAAMVNRFLGWPLPKTFSPDCGISFTPQLYGWPTGTNLFNVVEARALFEFVTAAPSLQQGKE